MLLNRILEIVINDFSYDLLVSNSLYFLYLFFCIGGKMLKLYSLKLLLLVRFYIRILNYCFLKEFESFCFVIFY